MRRLRTTKTDAKAVPTIILLNFASFVVVVPAIEARSVLPSTSTVTSLHSVGEDRTTLVPENDCPLSSVDNPFDHFASCVCDLLQWLVRKSWFIRLPLLPRTAGRNVLSNGLL